MCADLGRSDARATGGQAIVGLAPALLATFFHGDDHEIFSIVFLSLLLIQEGMGESFQYLY